MEPILETGNRENILIVLYSDQNKIVRVSLNNCTLQEPMNHDYK
jgi:hypothetical protein